MKQRDTDAGLSVSSDLAKRKDYTKEYKATVIQVKSLLVAQGSVIIRWPTGGSGEFVCVCVCVVEREEGSLLISCITAVISTLFITSSMCSVRFKIFKSVICQHYEVNTHSQDRCPIRHCAFHSTRPHIYH